MSEIRACQLCRGALPHAPRPIVQAGVGAKLMIIGQAPGARVHASGIPWDDASGERLRDWLGVDRDTFYDPTRTALMPMGFCYPGRGRSGDAPPRPECAPAWHDQLLAKLPGIRLTLLVGQYAQVRYLAEPGPTLTDTVRDFQRHLRKGHFPIPHPSPRNNIWMKKNAWFARDALPVLRKRVCAALDP